MTSNTLVITGGDYTMTIVSRYGTTGYMEDLPSLNQGRNSHGCGAYYGDDGTQVIVSK